MVFSLLNFLDKIKYMLVLSCVHSLSFTNVLILGRTSEQLFDFLIDYGLHVRDLIFP